MRTQRSDNCAVRWISRIRLWIVQAYRVGSVAGAREMDHTVEAGIGCAIALVPVRIQLLLGEHIAAILDSRSQYKGLSKRVRGVSWNARWELRGTSGKHSLRMRKKP